jgi:antitoxin component of MazEF toxin-antitoxin module
MNRNKRKISKLAGAVGFELSEPEIYIDVSECRTYNVITMKSTIIQIGNSRGIRIPKVMLEESGLEHDVEIKVTPDGLKITPVKEPQREISDTLALSQKVLAREWDTPEEDAAWASL